MTAARPHGYDAPVAENTLEERAARRARREERRAKQRLANVDRAAAMHGARLAYTRQQKAEAYSESAPKSPPPGVYVGCSGWYYWHWKGTFYPAELPGSKWFAHYASKFGTVELNAPFYSWPTVVNIKTWQRQAAHSKRFVYTVKVSELITHVKRFAGTRTLVRDFGHIADLLGPRMGCFLYQLPPSVKYSKVMLKRILGQLDPARRNVVEFRHKSWWNETTYAAFREAGAIFCSCSGPRLPDEFVRTADDVYVRFHGTTAWYRHDYTKAELAVWAGRIRDSGAKRVWCYFNNDRDGCAIKNAREMARQLKRVKPQAERQSIGDSEGTAARISS